MPEDDMGMGSAGKDPNGKSITEETFKEAAKSQGMTVKEAKEVLEQKGILNPAQVVRNLVIE
jgi:hypothetical protein